MSIYHRVVIKSHMLLLLLVSGCSIERDDKEHLSCYVNKVIDEQSGVEVEITYDEAIEQGFVYAFVIDKNGTLIINGAEKYQEITIDGISKRSHVYAVVLDDGIKRSVRYVFDDDYTGVLFQMKEKNISYKFSCQNNFF